MNESSSSIEEGEISGPSVQSKKHRFSDLAAAQQYKALKKQKSREKKARAQARDRLVAAEKASVDLRAEALDLRATALGHFVQELVANNQELRQAEHKRLREEKYRLELYRQQGEDWAARILGSAPVDSVHQA
jgi:hypothetical protein